jgi:hypothetical protein
VTTKKSEKDLEMLYDEASRLELHGRIFYGQLTYDMMVADLETQLALLKDE